MPASGLDIVHKARAHVGEKYIFGATVPKDNPGWKGPWDCAEFASWCVYQVSQKLYGCDRDGGAPECADAYTGYWGRDVQELGVRVSVDDAAATPGALVLRNPGEKCGHIVISDGNGGTIEAHSTARGVIADTLSSRRWDCGILVPWISYSRSPNPPNVVAPGKIYRVTTPVMSGDTVLAIQKGLAARQIDPGELDGKYGPHTAAAVRAFQLGSGRVADGEVGPVTAKALEIVRG